jgi:signal transduction histidine kinase
MDDRSFYAQVFDAVRDPLLVVDAAGDVHAANAAAIRFLDMAQETGLFGPCGSAEPADAAGFAIVGAGVLDLVRRRLAVRWHPLVARDGRDLGIVVDVEPFAGGTALLHFRSPTDRIARELWSDDAVAAVAHEIKNPLAAMRSALDVVLQDGALAQPHRRMLGAFDRSARRLARFVDGVLSVSQLNAGASPARRARVDVGDLVRGVVDEQRALYPQRRTRLECGIAEEDATAFVDRDGAEIVLLNLIGNAARFARENDLVTVRASRAGVESLEEEMRLLPWDAIGRPRLVRVDVEDHGLGMTPEVLAHLFERYRSVADADAGAPGAARGSSGTHLGMHISRAIVEAHDGWMRVESSLGEGTLVSVFFPEDEATAHLLSRVRMASDSARRWRRAGREQAVVVLGKTTAAGWDDVARRWPDPPRVDPLASTCASRRTLLWTFDADLAVALVPLASCDQDPSAALGDPTIRVEECAWGMRGFVAGWCRVEDATSFAQAFHRAAVRMRRACAHIAREEGARETGPTTRRPGHAGEPAAGAHVDEAHREVAAVLPPIQSPLRLDDNEE